MKDGETLEKKGGGTMAIADVGVGESTHLEDKRRHPWESAWDCSIGRLS